MRLVYDTCAPRPEVLEGALVEDIFAAEITPVVAEQGPKIYWDAERFFANTFPTQGLQDLIREVFTRLSGRGGNPLVRLETSFGGGKTHSLITLYHAAKHGELAPLDLLDPDLRPTATVNVAAVSGRDFGLEGREHDGVQVQTLWGEVAWQLGGRDAYAFVAESDRQGLAPSSDALAKVLGDAPALIMLDELGRYLRVAQGRKLSGVGTVADQVPAFLHSLAAAASMNSQAIVVITLAGDQDAYSDENKDLHRVLDETQKVAARQELVIRPTQDNEVAHVVVRRLFESVNPAAAAETAEEFHKAYQTAVDKQGADLPQRATRAEYRKELESTYPFHPELLHVLMTKTATIPEFQRTRGALRLLARVVRSVWEKREADAWLIRPADVDFANEQTRNDLTSRLGPDRAELAPVVQADIYSDNHDAHAQELDRVWLSRDKAPLASRLVRVVFLHSLTYGRATRAEWSEVLLASAQPDLDTELLREAMGELQKRCWYLHSDESAYWFNKEASPNKVIDEQLEQVTAAQGKEECRKRLRSIYEGGQLLSVYFPEQPSSIDDKDDRIRLAVIDFDFETLRTGDAVPQSIRRMFEKTGTMEGFRNHRNALLFLVADTQQVDRMVDAAREYKALQHINGTPDILNQLTESNRKVIYERMQKAEVGLRVAITRAYRHLLIPNPDAASDQSGLQMVTLDMEKAAKVEEDRKPGKPGQESVITEALVEHGKLMKADGPSPAPQLVLELAWPKGQQTMTTEELSKSFRRNPRLPMLLDNHRLRATVKAGIEKEAWVYFDGARIYNRMTGAPAEADIRMDAEHSLLTIIEANTRGFCERCGYVDCRCKGPKPTCPVCKAVREECKCLPCPMCGGKPWDCNCGKQPIDFISDKQSPQKAFASFLDWAKAAHIERIAWLELECYDRPADLQQLWIGMQYFVGPDRMQAEFDGTVELVAMQQAAGQNSMQSDEVRVYCDGSGGTFRRIFDFYHALAQNQQDVTYVAKLKASLPQPLAPDSGEIGDLRERLENGGVLEVTLRAGRG